MRRLQAAVIGVACVVNVVALSMNKLLPVHHRDVPDVVGSFVDASTGQEVSFRARNPDLSFPLVPEQLGMVEVTLLCIGIPALLVALAPRLVQTPPHFRRSVAIAWLQGHAINNTVTHTIKCVAGSPRPNFYALAAIGKELTGRKSFPSGHTSMAATAMTMLALLLIRTVKLHPRYVHSSAAAFALRWASIGLPALFAMWVGVTRTQDYYHSFADVLAGACVGVMSGVAGHFIEGLDEQLAAGGAMRRDSISGAEIVGVLHGQGSRDHTAGGRGTYRGGGPRFLGHPRSSSSSNDEVVAYHVSGDGYGRPASRAGGTSPVPQLFPESGTPSTPASERRDQFDTWPTPRGAGRGGGMDGTAQPALSQAGSVSRLRINTSQCSQASIMSHGI